MGGGGTMPRDPLHESVGMRSSLPGLLPGVLRPRPELLWDRLLAQSPTSTTWGVQAAIWSASVMRGLAWLAASEGSAHSPERERMRSRRVLDGSRLQTERGSENWRMMLAALAWRW